MVLLLFRGAPLDLLSRELGFLYRLEKWREAALAGREESFKTELDTAMQPRRVHHGDRTFVGPGEAPWPFSPKEVEEMRGTTSAAARS